jgi:ABC-type polysaccharide/polyol phosphate export permease
MMALFGMRLGWEALMFIPVLLIFSIFTFGVSLVLTAFNVYFRDVQIAWSSFMPAIFYATPIAYTPEIIPEKYRLVIELNPIHHYVSVLRELIYYNRMPDTFQLLLITLIAGASLWFGMFIFNKLKGGFISQF